MYLLMCNICFHPEGPSGYRASQGGRFRQQGPVWPEATANDHINQTSTHQPHTVQQTINPSARNLPPDSPHCSCTGFVREKADRQLREKHSSRSSKCGQESCQVSEAQYSYIYTYGWCLLRDI